MSSSPLLTVLKKAKVGVRKEHSLLKVKETILNGTWDNWWKNMRNHPITIAPYKPPLSASHFIQEASSSPIIQARIPALVGLLKDKPWVGVLRKLSQLEVY